MNRDNLKLDIYKSLNVNENMERITNASKNDGGKSG